MECPYPHKQRFDTWEDARRGASRIRDNVVLGGGVYNQLHPYSCPSGLHWHLSSARQAYKQCSSCQRRRPAWLDKQTETWVVYAHDNCVTQAVPSGQR